MFRTPFTTEVSFAHTHLSELSETFLFKEEENILPKNAATKKRTSFILGRSAARKALGQLGIEDCGPILKGVSGEPIWPKGVVGSIAHAGEFAVSATAFSTTLISLGIDLELVSSTRRSDVSKVVAPYQGEKNWIGEIRDQRQIRTLVVFSVKEAIYKALFPLCRKFFGFEEVELRPGLREGEFFVVYSTKLRNLLIDFKDGLDQQPPVITWEVYDFASASYVLSSVTIPCY